MRKVLASSRDTLRYPKEILELALKGVTSFHASEELWDNFRFNFYHYQKRIG